MCNDSAFHKIDPFSGFEVALPLPEMNIYNSHFYFQDVSKEMSSNKEIFEDYLPFAKTTIHETCTLVVATRVRSDQILIPTNRSHVFSKQYGDIAELKITFPAGVTEEILNLTVQVMFSFVALRLSRHR